MYSVVLEGRRGASLTKTTLVPPTPDRQIPVGAPCFCRSVAYAARMSNSDYTKDDLSRDLYLMVKAGLLEVSMREDGEWVYRPSEASLVMTDEEKTDIISRLDEFDDFTE